MELDKRQIERLRERHHRRHGIRPAHSEVAEQAGRFLKRAFNIREGRAPYHVIRKRFVNGARLTGSHLCILIIAMLIASIGLDIDSDIAIVGAMLICPLMGSVLAMAYGIATLDREITVEAVAAWLYRWSFAWSRPRCTLSSRPLAPPRPPSSTTRRPPYGTLPSRSRAVLRADWATRATRNPPRYRRRGRGDRAHAASVRGGLRHRHREWIAVSLGALRVWHQRGLYRAGGRSRAASFARAAQARPERRRYCDC